MGIEPAKLKKEYEIPIAFEISMDWNGWNYLIIFGRHKNGWFIAIPNHGICIEAAEPEDEFYNSEKLARTSCGANAGCAISMALADYWRKTHEREQSMEAGGII